MAKIKRALISVSDKTGLVPFCQGLAEHGVSFLSTGGTARLLRESGLDVMDVSEFTGFPEMLDGRVKTLHPKVHGGLLGLRDNASHQQQMGEHGIEPIDMVVVNLYPFEATVAKEGCTLEEAIENIDIGGPSMLRSAAKNYRSVTVVTDPADYARVLESLRAHDGQCDAGLNAQLARKVYARTAAYDAAISNWLSALDNEGRPGAFPETYTVQFKKVQGMRYGENPHQSAAFYAESPPSEEASLATATQLQGKELSFNNIHDANGALELVKEFSKPAAVVVKHANPCGVAVHDGDLLAAYRMARDTDPVSAFGGIIALNRCVDVAVAKEIAQLFVEVIIAPEYDEQALELFATKKNLRLLRVPNIGVATAVSTMDLKRVTGGLLLQDRDLKQLPEGSLKVVTERAPSEAEMRDLLFAWKVVKHVKSNAIVYAKEQRTLGVGAGQMSRVDASRIAVWKAQDTAHTAGLRENPLLGAAMASDAFFPFRDGVDAAAKAGAKAVIQPGGSVRDEEVIAAANEHGMAMVFTGMRHFKH
ncbi:IMP cyclohydrolase / phosphoribosylaminoimidazolecarboxamide formyltransferase [Magnetococcus marinus MC-1]|uniref:Bifunctional purine biosynthesis protein PurH n=1 Tax=Magnetococcus marinus (strain ATCC BAA-1437 / JCM 17883 / MC-1) TaxID=156889 RepID=PUR9_MAGMM|nr:bifunctional phosphoribosylaminoimidazolecarboxamide formyltransferase/IMP cyclohydrolase [Magnetococcus marinus]A0LDB0.1 RecName: Full=Bifunctional purine biosynthesis protein PurH; Includes: RecName: Full=Phosphoribosylaminoimidazolecarboxamide formyltransferase; AltName: Full=AICAR transformylase; Includes: RecName: Full=IMP cyclohydrolase; AltName: Full=ATIC; AltName: Full=IMP synthase; AltName: Full=Inosinicase [Magnetococcus marinus MC-1]ABK45953.1 IMP cyclohydrolase / phosphoribosylamin